MGVIEYLDRDMIPAERESELTGFTQNTLEHAVEIQTEERFGFAALDGEKFIMEMEDWYSNGDSQVGLRKIIQTEGKKM